MSNRKIYNDTIVNCKFCNSVLLNPHAATSLPLTHSRLYRHYKRYCVCPESKTKLAVGGRVYASSITSDTATASTTSTTLANNETSSTSLSNFTSSSDSNVFQRAVWALEGLKKIYSVSESVLNMYFLCEDLLCFAIDVFGDGNCFYRAISLILKDDEEKYYDIKTEV